MAWNNLLRAIVLVFSATSANAAVNWNVVTGDWGTASNWDLNRLPTTAEVASIANGRTSTITLPGATCQSLLLGDTTGSGAIQMNGGSLATSSQIVGSRGTGYFTQTAGTNNTSTLDLGGTEATTANGTYDLGGTATLKANRESIGVYGSSIGIFNQLKGNNLIGSSTTAGQLMIGMSPSTNGTYNLVDGYLTASTQILGWFGTGQFYHSGGTNEISDSSSNNGLRLAIQAGSKGNYYLSGTGQLVAPNEYIGSSGGGTALFQQSGGTNTVGFLNISSGNTYQLRGGVLAISGSIINNGTFDGGGGAGVLSGNTGIVDITRGTWTNLRELSVNMGPAVINDSSCRK